MVEIFKTFIRLPRYLVAFLVWLYQKTLSPDHGLLKVFFPHGYCKFKPSCSEYSKRAFLKHGVFWGGIKAFWRVLRCNPWSKGGVDEP
ncbi:membrane protein insertion efficiency factor YidD [Candidatus Peregrinibacteria bacterium]|nr:membrane protein insertion efficiency factor YidD [Candidatus Peregrinibacteria bacterium]